MYRDLILLYIWNWYKCVGCSCVLLEWIIWLIFWYGFLKYMYMKIWINRFNFLMNKENF